MRLLLDSHVLLWALRGDRQLDEGRRAELADARNEVFFSAASIWELEIKLALGRLSVEGDLEEGAKHAGFAELAVTSRHAARAARLPPLHRDPFDRMLVGQAQAERLTLVSDDPALEAYGVALLSRG